MNVEWMQRRALIVGEIQEIFDREHLTPSQVRAVLKDLGTTLPRIQHLHLRLTKDGIQRCRNAAEGARSR